MKETTIERIDICLNDFNKDGSGNYGSNSVSIFAKFIENKINELNEKNPEWQAFRSNLCIESCHSNRYGLEDHLILEIVRYKTEEESFINKTIEEQKRLRDLDQLRDLMNKYKEEAKDLLNE